MRNDQTVQFAMLVRVGNFGDERQALFRDGTDGRDALQVIKGAVAQIEAHAKSKATREREGVDAKASARRALIRQLEEVVRSARAIAVDTPGFDAPFALARPYTDQKLLTWGRTFVEAAEVQKERFVRMGMPVDFVTILSARVEALAAAALTLESGRNGTTEARTGIDTALETAMGAVHKLDAFVANACKSDPSTFSVWERCRKVDRSHRVRRRRARAVATEEAPTSAASQDPKADTGVGPVADLKVAS